ncbi:MAG: radical SAM protein [Clostridia bacterium]|nr:radical SAM protein [Clostridia bacterium]
MTPKNCMLCPRKCGADREHARGRCGAGAAICAARAALHQWEEPCISGKAGSGTVFFSHCTLKCVYCQNHEISSGGFGAEITPERLADIFLELEQAGAVNINLVTPTHYTYGVLRALDRVRHRLSVPVVMNTGGYELTETLRLWEGYIDIYLPDLKYVSAAPAERYSGAGDYFTHASAALLEMKRQQPHPRLEGGLLRRGMLVRHLVLPGLRRDSLAAVEWLAENLGTEHFLLSLMCQYTPNGRLADFPEIDRRVTTYEYMSAVSRARELGLRGYTQERGSAQQIYTPEFNLYGIQEVNHVQRKNRGLF